MRHLLVLVGAGLLSFTSQVDAGCFTKNTDLKWRPSAGLAPGAGYDSSLGWSGSLGVTVGRTCQEKSGYWKEGVLVKRTWSARGRKTSIGYALGGGESPNRYIVVPIGGFGISVSILRLHDVRGQDGRRLEGVRRTAVGPELYFGGDGLRVNLGLFNDSKPGLMFTWGIGVGF